MKLTPHQRREKTQTEILSLFSGFFEDNQEPQTIAFLREGFKPGLVERGGRITEVVRVPDVGESNNSQNSRECTPLQTWAPKSFSILILQFQGLNRRGLRVLKQLGMKSTRNHEPGVNAPELSKQPESEK